MLKKSHLLPTQPIKLIGDRIDSASVVITLLTKKANIHHTKLFLLVKRIWARDVLVYPRHVGFSCCYPATHPLTCEGSIRLVHCELQMCMREPLCTSVSAHQECFDSPLMDLNIEFLGRCPICILRIIHHP